MGISSNQARLLALTAKKCDLEAQMQLLLHRKLNIARETSDIANAYNKAISNRELVLFKPAAVNAPDVGTNTPLYQEINAQNLLNVDNTLIVYKDTAGQWLQVGINYTPEQLNAYLRDGTLRLVKVATDQTQDPQTITFGTAYAGGGVITAGTPPTTNNKWEFVDWRGSTTILDRLDQQDDADAQANYERIMNEIKEKESEMDLEINSIETQHSAISNELETTKKVMTKNTEDSFKYFS